MKKRTSKHFLSLGEISSDTINALINRANQFAQIQDVYPKCLDEKVVGIFFPKPSTRTRTSFTVAAMKLGAKVIAYGPNDLQLTTGEIIEDTARILSGYLDGMVIRTNDSDEDLRRFASGGGGRLSIINAMSGSEHPSQIICDLATIKEKFGRLNQVHLLYLGEGNNTAAGLALGIAQQQGMKATFITPKGYGLSDVILEQAQQLMKVHGGIIEHHHDMSKLPDTVDVVYATRWQTMGVVHPDPMWKEKFMPYQVSETLMKKVSTDNTIFLHDLPAVRGEDVEASVLDGVQSLAWRQGEYKLYAAMAILEWCLTDKTA